MNIRQKLLSTDGGKSMFEIEAEVVVDNMPNFSQIHGTLYRKYLHLTVVSLYK